MARTECTSIVGCIAKETRVFNVHRTWAKPVQDAHVDCPPRTRERDRTILTERSADFAPFKISPIFYDELITFGANNRRRIEENESIF